MKALSVSSGDYLKAIYELSREKSPVSTARIAEVMQVSKASVSDMLRKLNQRDYVHHRPYKGVTLSESGHKAAEELARRCSLWEQYLTRLLPCDAESAAAHAHQLEHATDEALETLLDGALKAEVVAPQPPTASEAVHRAAPPEEPPEEPAKEEGEERKTLAEIDAGHLCQIIACDAPNDAMADFLEANQLEPGKRLKILTVKDDGSRVVHVGGRDVTVNAAVSSRINVLVLL